MKVNILGCGDASASGGRMQTAFYVELPELNFMIDCGATALTGIKKLKIDHTKLDVVFISHLHGDHFGGIPYLLIDLNITERKDPLYIYGPKDTADKIKEVAELLYKGHGIDKNKFKVIIREYDTGDTIKFKGMKITSYSVKHSDAVHPHALRFEVNNKIICFSGDTQWVYELIPASDNSDLFICECSFYDTEFEGHMNYREIEKHLHEIKSKKIVLTHMSPEMLSIDVKLIKAEDLMVIEI
jgi:ribonuclease BN (tRNA processing enzyme)